MAQLSGKIHKTLSVCKKSALIAVISCVLAGGAAAAIASPGADSVSPPTTQTATRSFTGTFGGQRVDYTSTAGETLLRNAQGEPIGSIFSVTYTKKNAEASRPVVFIFNGGPGTSSMFLHMGLLGPQRVPLPQDLASAGNPPFATAANHQTILDIADLVFIDPVGTGYSRVVGAGKTEDFWGVEEDGRTLTEFMRIWLTNHGRWNSPKYILGESYGGTRAIQIVQDFQRAFTGLMPSGVILVAPAIDIRGIWPASGNDLAYPGFLPTYAATALHHDKVLPRPADQQRFLQDARDFAINEYAPALLKGNMLQAGERQRVIEKLAYFTGLSQEFVAQADLRIDANRFRKELLRDRGKIVGKLDGRYLGDDRDDAGAAPESDPASTAMENAYVSAYFHHLTRTLGVEIERPYHAYSRLPSATWRWSPSNRMPTGLNMAPILGEAMRLNPEFRVLMINGLYDMSTPIFANELAIADSGINPKQVVQKGYVGGHMAYTHEPSMGALLKDLRIFLSSDGSRTDE